MRGVGHEVVDGGDARLQAEAADEAGLTGDVLVVARVRVGLRLIGDLVDDAVDAVGARGLLGGDAADLGLVDGVDVAAAEHGGRGARGDLDVRIGRRLDGGHAAGGEQAAHAVAVGRARTDCRA